MPANKEKRSVRNLKRSLADRSITQLPIRKRERSDDETPSGESRETFQKQHLLNSLDEQTAPDAEELAKVIRLLPVADRR